MTSILPCVLSKMSCYCRFVSYLTQRKLVRIRHLNFSSRTPGLENSSASVSACQSGETLKQDVAYKTNDFYLDGLNSDVIKELQQSMLVLTDFLSGEEEHSLMQEIQPYIRRLRYEVDHWDKAIHGYRETEKRKWNSPNTKIIQRLRDTAFPPGVGQLQYVHVLDLSEEGVINPHVDSVRFCGDTIAGLSLLSDAVMRLAKEKDPSTYADILLPKRSLYIMKGAARYDYSHAVLSNKESFFKGSPVAKTRRVSVICRNEPQVDDPAK